MRRLIHPCLIALTATAGLVGAASAQAPEDRRPGHIRVVFQDDPATSATISWTTQRGRGRHRVHFDTVPHGRDQDAYRYRVDAQINDEYDDEEERHESGDHYHHARISGLQPDTVYHFLVRSDGRDAPRALWFRTAPRDPDQPFKLLVGGDGRTTSDDPDDRSDRQRMNRVMAQLFAADPSILALSYGGDYVQDGQEYDHWDDWLEDHSVQTTLPNGRVLPIIPTRGNHEEDRRLYNQVLGFPGADNARGYFTTRIGDFALVTLDSQGIEDDDSTLDRQTDWLRTQLRALSGEFGGRPVRWLTASYHRPAFPAHKSWDGGPAEDIRDEWVPLFGQYGTNLIFESDGHTYKRTRPLLNRARFDRAPDCDADGDADESLGPVVCDPDDVTTVERGGVYYVGEGGLGANLREPSNRRAFLDPGQSRRFFHVMLLDVTPDALTLHLVDQNGCFVDEPGGPRCARDVSEDGPLTLARRTVVPFESEWRFLEDADSLPFGFEQPVFDDRFWPVGRGQLGYGDDDERIEIDDDTATAYFRKTIYVDHAVAAAEITALHDDGVAVYVNGQLVGQRYLPFPQVHGTFASAQSDDDEITHFEGPAVADAFVPGENVIAVVVKQVSDRSSDLSFDMRVTLTAPLGGAPISEPEPEPDAGPVPGPEVDDQCVSACAVRESAGCPAFDLERCWSECSEELASLGGIFSIYLMCHSSATPTCDAPRAEDGVFVRCIFDDSTIFGGFGVAVF